MARQPVFAGSFYPASKQLCERMLESFKPKPEPEACAVVSPHAGWVYSGRTAMRAVERLKGKGTVVVVSPNHTGIGEAVSVSKQDWVTPLGEIKCDAEAAQKIVDEGFAFDEAAHGQEHSIEVQLPFIQKLFPEARLVAVTMADQSLEIAGKLGEALAKLDVAVIASSDFTHYEPAKQAKQKDDAVLAALEGLDVKEFYDALKENECSACGYGPIAAAATFAKKRGAKKARVIDYSNSGQRTRDESSVVDYYAIEFI
ncbi:AmmeMemoRadiSam system protein B [Candidatus Micrarchaeota archaeon CG_4_10_14_0_2_um_filter_55_9]|nr:MAG: AmmeMemoRadiSam system protein B [Candidatus Micrarchaeota archaeon CG_4_10_14_0_2_um_filter_55_9]PJD01178.1 MAG: AmmeMemoRadiSam system protein B [Candidatus Micrarchaeota archaeon CG10_big_fil_rev_8_21_14_0_10_54_18]